MALYVKCHAPKKDMSSSLVFLIDNCQSFILKQIKISQKAKQIYCRHVFLKKHLLLGNT